MIGVGSPPGCLVVIAREALEGVLWQADVARAGRLPLDTWQTTLVELRGLVALLSQLTATVERLVDPAPPVPPVEPTDGGPRP